VHKKMNAVLFEQTTVTALAVPDQSSSYLESGGSRSTARAAPLLDSAPSNSIESSKMWLLPPPPPLEPDPPPSESPPSDPPLLSEVTVAVRLIAKVSSVASVSISKVPN